MDSYKLAELIILFGGFCATVWTLHKNNETRKTEIFQDMGKEERYLHLELSKILGDIEKEKKAGNTNVKYLQMVKEDIVQQLLNFFEHLALLINENKINQKLALQLFDNDFREIFTNYKKDIYPDYKQIIKLSDKLGLGEKMDEQKRKNEKNRNTIKDLLLANRRDTEVRYRTGLIQLLILIGSFFLAYSGELEDVFVIFYIFFIILAIFYYIGLTRVNNDLFTFLWGYLSSIAFTIFILAFINSKGIEYTNWEWIVFGAMLIIGLTYALLPPDLNEKLSIEYSKFKSRYPIPYIVILTFMLSILLIVTLLIFHENFL